LRQQLGSIKTHAARAVINFDHRNFTERLSIKLDCYRDKRGKVMLTTELEVTLSQQYQVPMPQEIRDLLNLKVGQKVGDLCIYSLLLLTYLT
jgi:hypothetical protein